MPGVGMYGFTNRKGGATGVLDPLMARVLVLEAGEKRLALVALDLGEPPAGEWIRTLRQRAAKTSGTSYVLVAATHTHSGPRIRDEYPPKQAPDWESPVREKVAQAIDDALRDARSAPERPGGLREITHPRFPAPTARRSGKAAGTFPPIPLRDGPRVTA